MICHGNAADHCCYFGGKVCKYLEENTMPNRRWVCALMREHQDWDKVLADSRYQNNIVPLWEEYVWPSHGRESSCKDFPDPVRCCCG